MTEISLSDYQERRKPEPIHNGFVVSPKAGMAVLAIVLLAASFFAGVAYQKSKHSVVTTSSTASSQGTSQAGGRGSFGGGFQRGDRAIGTVTSVSDSSITITTRAGTASTYTLSSNTTVTNDGQTGSISDIQTGDTVFLTLDSSNTQDVTSIDLNPSFGGPGGGSSSGTGTSSGTPDSSTDATGT